MDVFAVTKNQKYYKEGPQRMNLKKQTAKWDIPIRLLSSLYTYY